MAILTCSSLHSLLGAGKGKPTLVFGSGQMHVPESWQDFCLCFNNLSVVDRGANRDLTFDKITGQGLFDGRPLIASQRGLIHPWQHRDTAGGLLVTFRHRGDYTMIYDIIVLATLDTMLRPMICCQIMRLTAFRTPTAPIKVDLLLLMGWLLKEYPMYKEPPHTITTSSNGW